MLVRVVSLEGFGDHFEDAVVLYDDLFAHMVSLVALDAEPVRGAETLEKEIPREDWVTCDWCDGTGKMIGDLMCYMCAGICRRPSQRAMRKMSQETSSGIIRLSRAIDDTAETVAYLSTMDQGAYEALRETSDEHLWDHEDLDKEIAAMRAKMEEWEESRATAEELVREIEKHERLHRIASKAVAIRITDTVIEEQAVGVEPQTCRCGKPVYVRDENGVAWCKRHAHARGLLQMPEPEPEPEPPEPPGAPETAAQRREMTRPLRFIGGPYHNTLRRVPRGETKVVVDGARYERRGHVFEFVG